MFFRKSFVIANLEIQTENSNDWILFHCKIGYLLGYNALKPFRNILN